MRIFTPNACKGHASVISDPHWSNSNVLTTGPLSYLLIHIANGLLALPVHVQDLQEGLVHALVGGEARLRAAAQHSSVSTAQPEQIAVCIYEFACCVDSAGRGPSCAAARSDLDMGLCVCCVRDTP